MAASRDSVRKLVAAAAVAVSLAAGPPAGAAVIQLGFIIDESGSIGPSNYGIIKSGLANAIDTLIPIGGANTYEVSVVSFASNAQTLVNHVLIDSAAARTAVRDAILADSFTGGWTDYAAAFSLMTSVITSSPAYSAGLTQYINFATDGEPTDGGYKIRVPAYCSTNPGYTNWLACWRNGGSWNGVWVNPPDIVVSDEQAGIDARNALIAAGIDNISIEGIDIGASGAGFLKTSICYPTPCDATVPYDFPNKGFYIPVASAQGYADAIGPKIRTILQEETVTETATVPEPATIALLGLGLATLGVARRRRRRL